MQDAIFFMKEDVQLQRDFYTRTASDYDLARGEDRYHDFSCALLGSIGQYYQIQSVLDVGCGTGRAILKLSKSLPDVKVIGVEPVEAMRAIGHAKGIPERQLIEGDACHLQFADASVDFVSAFGVLHHIPQPRQAVAEMLRVAKMGIFISDSNRFGQGPMPIRYLKRMLWLLGLWPSFDLLRTKGRGYLENPSDGISYSYSLFDDYDFICSQCDRVMIFNVTGTGANAMMGASNVGLFALKRGIPQ